MKNERKALVQLGVAMTNEMHRDAFTSETFTLKTWLARHVLLVFVT